MILLFPSRLNSVRASVAKAAFFMVVFAAAGKILALDPSSQGGQSVLVLRDKAEVSGEEIRLSDLLAENSNISPGNFIPGKVVTGVSPSVGKNLTVRRAELDAILARKLPQGSYLWSGAQECVVSRASIEMSESQLLELIEAALRDYTKGEGEARVIRILNYAPIQVPKDGALPQVDLVSPNARSPFGSATLDVASQGKLHIRRNVRFEWEWKKLVWIASDAQMAGPVQQNSFVREMKNTLNVLGEPFAEEALPDPLVLGRPVARGDILLKTNLSSVIAVSRGASVTAQVQSGLLLVSMRAVALENGAIGQTIRLQNPQSRKEIFGKVIHANVVEVTP